MIDVFGKALIDTSRDVFAVSALLLGFQYLVLRQPIPPGSPTTRSAPGRSSSCR